jgi:hypothetical protein
MVDDMLLQDPAGSLAGLEFRRDSEINEESESMTARSF